MIKIYFSPAVAAEKAAYRLISGSFTAPAPLDLIYKDGATQFGNVLAGTEQICPFAGGIQTGSVSGKYRVIAVPSFGMDGKNDIERAKRVRKIFEARSALYGLAACTTTNPKNGRIEFDPDALTPVEQSLALLNTVLTPAPAFAG